MFSLLKGNRERPYDTLYRCEISGYGTKKDNIKENLKCYERWNIATNMYNAYCYFDKTLFSISFSIVHLYKLSMAENSIFSFPFHNNERPFSLSFSWTAVLEVINLLMSWSNLNKTNIAKPMCTLAHAFSLMRNLISIICNYWRKMKCTVSALGD